MDNTNDIKADYHNQSRRNLQIKKVSMTNMKSISESILSEEGGYFEHNTDDTELLCSQCFDNEGLKIDAYRIGIDNSNKCKNCGSENGKKLSKNLANNLVKRFFVGGTLIKHKYGAAPLLQFNEHRQTDLTLPSNLSKDCKLISEILGIGFFEYGPRMWMMGWVTPLEDLLKSKTRNSIIERIFQEYPAKIITPNESLYRLRKNPKNPIQESEYDSPPSQLAGKCRIGSKDLSILYASLDVEVCIHECRSTIEDELYVGTLAPKRDLKLLDLTELLEETTTEFESLDIAIQMLFSAGKHAYKISRLIALSAKQRGFDGIIYPSYFSSIRTGSALFDTIYGLSIRRIPEFKEYIKSQTIPNFALFGNPIADKLVEVKCINKLVLKRASYDFLFGPVGI